MRIFKFRGLDVNSKWHFGNLNVITVKLHGVDPGSYISNIVGMPFAYNVRPETVGQYTGLNDRNGKESYENDLCISEDSVYQIVWMDDLAKYGLKVIKTDYVLTKNLTFPMWQYVDKETKQLTVEVIGNIYENHELVEK